VFPEPGADADKVREVHEELEPSMMGAAGGTQLNVPGAPDMSVNDARVVARL
jgi:hypothetical protein